jgi:hypothetical protein
VGWDGVGVGELILACNNGFLCVILCVCVCVCVCVRVFVGMWKIHQNKFD